MSIHHIFLLVCEKRHAMEPTFSVVNLPKLLPGEYTPDNPIAKMLAEKFRSLRLFALQENPEAFGSSYQAEVQRDLQHTLDRLQMPAADHFIAVDSIIPPWSPETSAEFFKLLFDATWTGVLVKIGPSGSAGSITQNNLQLAADGSTNLEEIWESMTAVSHYQLGGTFVAPTYRGHGIARALMAAVFDKSQAEVHGRGVGIRFTVLVDSENWPARRLYERAGFQEIAKEAHVQIARERVGESESKDIIAVKMELVKAVSRSS